MFKNIIIIILAFVVFSLMVQKPENVDILVKDAATAKNMVVEGADYLHETFDREFSVHSEEEFQKEHGTKKDEVIEKKDDVSFLPDYNPSRVVTNDGIVEETFWNEK